LKALFLLENEERGRRCILVRRERKIKENKNKNVTIIGGK
jgi:hypothetical protein